MPCRLLIVRHGQSEWNRLGRWQGQADPPLTAEGERQAERAGRQMAAESLTFDKVLSSDLVRAQRTAEVLAEHVGGSGVTADPALRERNAGVWEGLTRAEINEGWPGQIAARDWPEGFESETSVAARLLPALQPHLADANQVLMVAHAGVLKTLERLTGLPDEPVPNLCGRWFHIDTLSTAFSYDDVVPGERADYASTSPSGPNHAVTEWGSSAERPTAATVDPTIE